MTLDPSAFESRPGVYDADGLLVPVMWSHCQKRWDNLPLSTRRTLSDSYLAELVKQEAKQPRASRPAAKRYTTAYAVAWGRKQGWKHIDTERYDFRNKRHHDLQLGADVMFEGPDGLILIQGAGQYERKEHRARFEARGGEEKARRRHLKFIYLEFVRGSKDPILREDWA